MSHTVYETDAFIMGVEPRGETGVALKVLTRNHGCVYVHAQGVRQMSSKLRSHIQRYAHSKLSLVRGKDRWVLVGAKEEVCSTPHPRDSVRFASYVRILAFVGRYVAGEHADSEVYAIVHDSLGDVMNAALDDVPDVELAVIARLCVHLGYIETREMTRSYVSSARLTLVQEINSALRESHL